MEDRPAVMKVWVRLICHGDEDELICHKDVEAARLTDTDQILEVMMGSATIGYNVAQLVYYELSD